MHAKIKKIGNDLFADFECSCSPEKYKGTALASILKTQLQHSGYNDDYFFETVNKEQEEFSCHCCGKKYLIQWKKDPIRCTIEFLNVQGCDATNP